MPFLQSPPLGPLGVFRTTCVTLALAGGMTLLGASSDAFTIDESVKSDRGAVKELQEQLTALGFDVGRPDGVFGRRTQAGIEGFAARFPTDGAEGLTAPMLERVNDVHTGRFGRATPDAEFPSFSRRFVFTTDIRNDLEGCDACGISNMVLGSGDFNGDGRDEVIVTQHVGDNDYRPLNRASPLRVVTFDVEGSRNKRATVLHDATRRVHAREQAVADFNGDGFPDLFVSSHGHDVPPFPGEQNVLLLSSGAEGGFVDVSDTHLPQLNDMAHGVASGDVDGDGDVDLLVITNEGSSRVNPYLLRNDGSARFEFVEGSEIMPSEIWDMYRAGRDFPAYYSTARLVDLNADGSLDLLMLVRGETPDRLSRNATRWGSLLLYNDGTGQFPMSNLVELPTDRWGDRTFTNDAEALDLDGDGDLDLLLTQSTRTDSWTGQYFQVLLQTESGWVDRSADRLWAQGTEAAVGRVDFANKTELVDLDGDGDLDFVTNTGNPAYFRAVGDLPYSVGINDGTGHFSPLHPRRLSINNSYQGRDMVVGDFDGDGRPDIMSQDLNYLNGPELTVGVSMTLHQVRFVQ